MVTGVKGDILKFILDKPYKKDYYVSMDTKQNKSIGLDDLGEMTFPEMTALWRKQRGLVFKRLNEKGMTYDEIAETYKTSRQYIGMLIKRAEEAK